MFSLGQLCSTVPRNPSTSSSFFIRDILGSDTTSDNNDFNTNEAGKCQTAFEHVQNLDMGLTPTPFMGSSYQGNIPAPGVGHHTDYTRISPYPVYPTIGRGFPMESLVEFRDAMTLPIPLPVYIRSRSPDEDGYMKARKCRRSRTVFTELQLVGLEKKFENHKYLSTPERIELADTLGLSQLQVKTWYQNRRMKWKKVVLQTGAKESPTKPKGRPRKDNSELESESPEQQTNINFSNNSNSSVVNNNQSAPLSYRDHGSHVYQATNDTP